MDDHDEEKRREQNLIVRSRKSEAELALDVFCTVEATDRHLTSRGLSAKAGVLECLTHLVQNALYAIERVMMSLVGW